jgi:hypothetical protein
MADGVLLMSGSERERAFLVRQSVEGRLGQLEASERLGISVRQFKRLVRAWRFCHVSRRLQRVALPEPSDYAICMMPIAMRAR